MEMFNDTSFPHFREDMAITKDEDYLHNPDKQAKVSNLGKQIDPVRCFYLTGLTSLSMNSITRPRRRLHLWREKDRIRNENAEIKNLESKYLSSFEEFKNKFNSGTIPDSYTYSIETDYLEWEGLVNRLSKYNSLF